jgi:alpha-galactosidase
VRCRSMDNWPAPRITSPEVVQSPNGLLQQVRLITGPDENGLQCTITFALPEGQPLFLWRLSLENQGPRPVNIDRIELLSTGHHAGRPDSGIHPLEPELAFFSNGWQSWSYAGVHGQSQRFRHTRLGPFRTPADVNAGTPQPGDAGHFSSDMFGILGSRKMRLAVLAGFLSQLQHFGSVEAWTDPSGPSLRLWANGDGARLDPGEGIATDWACLQFLDIDDPNPLAPYLNAVARQHHLNSSNSSALTPTGWCSWYQFSSEQFTGALTAQNIRENLEEMDRLRHRVPLRILQIDDGYESQIGDWYSFGPTFSEGMAPLAAEIKAAGFTPGLWLAPFIVHPKSQLAASHPEWLLRGRSRRYASAGFLWNTFPYALDLTIPEALEYASQLIHTAAHEWGYPYLKLDFLYAASLAGRYHDPKRTRAQVLRAGLEALREAAGDQTFLLGCGCPLGPAIGLVDGMRIGADTAQRWNFAFSGIEFFVKEDPGLPAVRNATHNAITRSPLHKRWWINDPDCLLLREETHLTLAEVQTAATVIALTGGSLLLSDDLDRLSADRLRIAETLLPLIDRSPRVLDWFDAADPRHLRLDLENRTGKWSLLAFFNWDKHRQDLTLRLEEYGLDPRRTYLAREFWSGAAYRIAGGELALQAVPPHGVALLTLREFLPGKAQYLGSDLHISQGLEIAAWEVSEEGLHFRLGRPGETEGKIIASLPQPPREIDQDGQAISWQESGEGLYSFSVKFNRTADIHLSR